MKSYFRELKKRWAIKVLAEDMLRICQAYLATHDRLQIATGELIVVRDENNRYNHSFNELQKLYEKADENYREALKTVQDKSDTIKKIEASLFSNPQIVSVFMMECIIKSLPESNMVGESFSLKEPVDFFQVPFMGTISEMKITKNPDRNESGFGLISCSLEILDWDFKCNITLVKKNWGGAISGIQTEVNSWAWDLRHSGLQILDNNKYDLIQGFYKTLSEMKNWN